MALSGNILKMKSEIDNVVNYYLPIGNEQIFMNDLIGKKLSISYKGQINCIRCGRKTNKSFSQGFCYPCFRDAPEADPAIVKPELDMAHKGISRDMEWAKTHSLVDHFVYLSYSGNLKIGVTRHTQIPTRWIDQGAVAGITIAKTPYRNLAGKIEVLLKDNFADKTNWRKMLKLIKTDDIDLLSEKKKAVEFLKDTEYEEFIMKDDEHILKFIEFPVEKYPLKVKSLNLDKIPEFEKKLTGIKGQYLIFDDDTVMNIRKHNGYFINLNY
jgi:hypothetical protein